LTEEAVLKSSPLASEREEGKQTGMHFCWFSSVCHLHFGGLLALGRPRRASGMGFLSFIGRVAFSAIFILAAWQK
jgi:hypothetical protein